jgi:uridine kinase
LLIPIADFLERNSIPMDFEIYLTEQLHKHPSMQPQDVIKMCYQAAHGAEHLLSDSDRAWSYLKREYDEATASDDALYEQISNKVCRVNLSAWKSKGLPIEWLFRMFVASCKVEENAKEQFGKYLQDAEKIINSGETGFTTPEWDKYLSEYIKIGMPAVHHSEEYREHEHPMYRIVDSRFCRTHAILEKAKTYVQGNTPCIIAIDGRAASGKTTLANYLQIVLDADVIHMDDFFVPSELRSEERFEKPGENIHHERFAEEVLPFIAKQEPFSYRIFDCSRMDYNGVREVGNKTFRIVEGSYSCHPILGAYADITVFSDVSSNEQTERIRKRNGEEMLKMFLTRWIPMEEEYFSHYMIGDKADIRV